MTDYATYLQSPEWITRREAAKARSGNRCSVCSSEDDLQVHHNSYARLGAEDPADLVVLCKDCHALFHDRLAANASRTDQVGGIPPRVTLTIPEGSFIDTAMLEVFIAESSEFKRTWLHARPGQEDWSMAQYDLRLCSLAAEAGCSQNQLGGLIYLHHQTYYKDSRPPRDYVEITVAKAMAGADKAQDMDWFQRTAKEVREAAR